MDQRAKIQYRGFYDRPLAFVAEHRNKQLLFWLDFDELLDEYKSEYQVFMLADSTVRDLIQLKSWENLRHQTTGYLGTVPVRNVQFDETRRKEIDVNAIDVLLDK